MINFSNLTQFQVDESFIKKIAQEILKEEKKEKEDLSIVIVGPKRIKFLNKNYRKKNKVTTVLSFPLDPPLLGEIFICPRRIKKEAKRKNIPFKEEFLKILIHGILNLTEKSEEKRGEKEEIYFEKIKKWQKN